MPSKIYKVFISSTFKDLETERKKVIDGLLSMNCMPVAMEFFPGSDQKPGDLITRLMNDCDYYILIIKGKYGSIDAGTGKSYTEMEYDYAVENKIPVLGFIYADTGNLKLSEVDTSKKLREQLKKFTHNTKMRTIKNWTDPETLTTAIILTLEDQFINNSKQGFIKETIEEAIKTIDEIEVQKEKIGYIKFLRLSRAEDTNNLPLYKRFIPRLNKNIDVFDELILFSTNTFDEEISGFQRSDYTSGVVDFDILYPWQPSMINRQGIVQEGGLIQTFLKSSADFFTATYFFNSFQKNQEFRITMEKPTKSAKLIFDFSFLPGHQFFIEADKIKAFINYTTKPAKAMEVNTTFPGYYNPINTSGIYWTAAENLEKNDVLIFDFSEAINWSKLKNSDNS